MDTSALVLQQYKKYDTKYLVLQQYHSAGCISINRVRYHSRKSAGRPFISFIAGKSSGLTIAWVWRQKKEVYFEVLYYLLLYRV